MKKDKKLGLRIKIENDSKILTIKTLNHLGEFKNFVNLYYICTLSKNNDLLNDSDFLYQVVRFKSMKYKNGIYSTLFEVFDPIGWDSIWDIEKCIKDENFRFLYEEYESDIKNDEQVMHTAYDLFNKNMKDRIKKSLK